MKNKIILAALLLILMTSGAFALTSPETVKDFFLTVSEPLKTVLSQNQKSTESSDSKPKTQKSAAAPVASAQTIGNNQQEIPLQVTYLLLFKQIEAFEAKAAEIEKQGGDGSSFRTLIQRLAKLNDAEFTLLRKIALDCVAKVKVKDESARKVTAQIRASLPKVTASGENALSA